MKATYRTDQTNVPDTLPQRHHLCSLFDCVCVCVQTKLPGCCSVWKAISIEPLSWNTIACVCVYCVCLCVFVRGLFTCCNATLIPERTPGAPSAPTGEGKAVLTPHGPPFEFFSVFGRCSRVSGNVFVSVRCGFGITHPVCHQIECAASVFLILADLFFFCQYILF